MEREALIMSSKPPTIELPTTFEELVSIHMLRPIHDNVGYTNACEMLDRLSGLALAKDQEEYLEALTLLVEDYEGEPELTRKKATALEVLRYLCEENGLSGTGLAEILGTSRALGSKILSGERRLTVSHIAKLAKRFSVSADLFVRA
jgi:HTH-type transcriptional regulator/antitoxin HigA